VLFSNMLYLIYRASILNTVVFGRMLNEESKCSVFKESRRCCKTEIAISLNSQIGVYCTNEIAIVEG
jgi:hypothetical protein